VLKSILSGPAQVRKMVIPDNPKDDVRSDLLRAGKAFSGLSLCIAVPVPKYLPSNGHTVGHHFL
jgi:hypothetical protein